MGALLNGLRPWQTEVASVGGQSRDRLGRSHFGGQCLGNETPASMTKATTFFVDGDQAVRLPAEFRFDGPVVHVRRDELTGDVVLSVQPAQSSPPLRWADFMALRAELGPLPDDLLADIRQGMWAHDGDACTGNPLP